MVLFPRTSSRDPQGHRYSLTSSHHRQALALATHRQGWLSGWFCSELSQPPWLREANHDAPQSCLHCSTQSPAESSPSPSSCRHQTTWLLSVQLQREEHVMQTRCQRKECNPSLLTPKAHRGLLM